MNNSYLFLLTLHWRLIKFRRFTDGIDWMIKRRQSKWPNTADNIKDVSPSYMS